MKAHDPMVAAAEAADAAGIPPRVSHEPDRRPDPRNGPPLFAYGGSRDNYLLPASPIVGKDFTRTATTVRSDETKVPASGGMAGHLDKNAREKDHGGQA
jgi:hypothetical protein